MPARAQAPDAGVDRAVKVETQDVKAQTGSYGSALAAPGGWHDKVSRRGGFDIHELKAR